MNARVILISFLSSLVFSQLAQGQTSPSRKAVGTRQHQSKEIQELKKQLEEIQQQNQKQIEELKKSYDEKFEELEMEDLERAAEEIEELQKKLHVFGFFGVDYFDWRFGNPAISLYLSDHATFAIPAVNLSVLSRLSDSLQALVELRYTFSPLGQETSFDISALNLTYQRTNTLVQDRLTSDKYNLGGMLIEQAHLTWQPIDYFGITVGRFVTPYGIWNIDHGAPVLIPVLAPYVLLSKPVPLWQTGIKLFGRFFPASRIYLDYALTVSNGSGPIESVLDLDQNKAGGLRLRLTYESPNFTAALGGYLYYSDYTDTKKVVTPTSEIKEVKTDYHHELTGSLDLLIEFYKVRLQAEYVRGKIYYAVRRQEHQINYVIPAEGFHPDYILTTYYVMLAYELPLKQLLGDMTLTPFVMYDYYVPDDTIKDYWLIIYRAGLNFKPSPFVVLKTEFVYTDFFKSDLISYIWSINGQVAVSF